MKASELIKEIQKCIDDCGDMDVFLDVGPNGLLMIDEVGVDLDDTGIILWGPSPEDAA